MLPKHYRYRMGGTDELPANNGGKSPYPGTRTALDLAEIE